MPKISRLEAFDENDLPVGVVTIVRRETQGPSDNTVTWACGVADCTTTGEHQTNTANAVAALEDHLTLSHSS
jgi:hypothetical protein